MGAVYHTFVILHDVTPFSSIFWSISFTRVNKTNSMNQIDRAC
jgi:hypothetical protein